MITRIITEQNRRAVMKMIWDSLADWLKGSEKLEITVRPYKSKRSTEQNKRLWAIYKEFSDVAWVNGRQYDSETWHEYLKRKFIGCEEHILPDGSAVTWGISTTTLDTAEMTEYQNNIQAYGSQEFGIEWKL